MLSQDNAKGNQKFRILVVSAGTVGAEEVIDCGREVEAFARARQTAARVGRHGSDDISVYVLDSNNVFLGAVSAERTFAALAA
jgi:hypothetical protein